MNKLLKHSVILLTLLLSSAFTTTAQNIDLKLNLKKGDRFYVLMDTDQDISQTMMGQEMQQKQVMTMGYDFDVVDVNGNGDYKIQVTYRKIVYKNKNAYSEILYDSEIDSTHTPGTESFDTLINASFYFTCNAYGNVSEVKGLDEIAIKMVETNSNNLTVEQIEETKKSYIKQFGNESMKSDLSKTMDFYPKNTIKVGSTWQKTVMLNASIPMTLVNTWSLNTIKGDIAFIGVDSNIQTTNDDYIQNGEMQYKYDISSGKQVGEMEVDINSGLIRKSVIKQDIKGDMSMISETIKEPVVIPMTIQSTVSTTMTKK